ncbi:MAG: flagellar biosynthesis protein FlhF [Armatimonadota bacterium]|nr:flagellar biosynthesis protein FlhF [bacterium]
MRIKTFEAPTMQEALVLAKMELGEDAVVLNTKHVKSGGILGLGGNDKVELMAAVEDSRDDIAVPAMSVPTPSPAMAPATFAARAYTGVSIPAPEPTPAFRELVPETIQPKETNNETTQLRSELSELKQIVQALLQSQGMPVMSPSPKTDVPLLIRCGVDEDLAKGVLSDLLFISDPTALAAALAAKLQGFAMPPVLDKREVIAVVGPTGVGKTTTLAKLAAKFSLEQGKKVALVTADTYRIGAVEQLRTYARIMGVPLEIALSPEEVAAGVAKHADKDVVLIDTVGRSQRSDEHLVELKSFIDAAAPTQVHLVISASLAPEIQREAVDKFAMLSPTNLIITKLDESPNRGCVVNLPLRTGLGISCMTAGQNVPQDIDLAEAGKMARVVLEVA